MVTITTLDLDNLPAPTVVEELNFETILDQKVSDLIDRFPAIAGVIGLETEPARKLLETDAFGEAVLRARINDAIRSQLIAFATGADLDHLAAFYDVIRLDGESDDRLRSRVVFTIAGRSTGGTAARYRSVAMSATIEVRDAIVYRAGVSPVVNVAVFSYSEGGIPSQAVLDEVSAALNDNAVRMVNDTIAVRSAVTQSVDIEAKVWLLPTAEMAIYDGLEEILRADYDREGGLGFDLTRAWLTARLMRPGVQRVEIIRPAADIPASEFEALAFGEVTLTYEGRAI